MATKRLTTILLVMMTALALEGLHSTAFAQAPLAGRQPIHFQVSQPVERLEMIVNTSRIINCEYKIPELMIDNPTIVRASAISPTQVQVSALKPGFTTITLFDESKKEHAVDVLVYGDARELENLLMAEFPEANLRVRPLSSSVVVTGYVPRAELVGAIIRMAEDYYPQVINNITVGGAQTILLHVKLMEVSRTKLRRVGFDWANFNGNDGVVQTASGMVSSYSLVPGAHSVTQSRGETVAFGIINNANSFFGFLEALKQNNLVKVLAEPTLVAQSGRAASFSSGGEFPILVPQSLGTVSIQFRQFGTRVDFVPIVLGNGRVRLEVRPQVSEIDPTRSVSINGTTVPGLRSRWVDTAVEMNAGQTLALAGLIQTQVESESRGVPWLSDLPWFGAAFRHVRHQSNEIELLVLVTPEFVDALDPQDVPPCGPGELTTSPSDSELYLRGYLEVPRNCDNCRDNGPPCSPTFLLDQPGVPTEGEPIMATPQPATAQRDFRAPTPVAGPQSPPATEPRYYQTSGDAPPQPPVFGPAAYQPPR